MVGASGEFQKILDHSGLVWNCWTGALGRGVHPVLAPEPGNFGASDSRELMGGNVVPYYGSSFHDEPDALELADVTQWVA